MDVTTISRMAYEGKMPEGVFPYEMLLWYRLRDIYQAVKTKKITEAKGREKKQEAVSAYENERDTWERCVCLWKRVEPVVTAYAKSAGRTPEGDRVVETLYNMRLAPFRKGD